MGLLKGFRPGSDHLGHSMGYGSKKSKTMRIAMQLSDLERGRAISLSKKVDREKIE